MTKEVQPPWQMPSKCLCLLSLQFEALAGVVKSPETVNKIKNGIKEESLCQLFTL